MSQDSDKKGLLEGLRGGLLGKPAYQTYDQYQEALNQYQSKSQPAQLGSTGSVSYPPLASYGPQYAQYLPPPPIKSPEQEAIETKVAAYAYALEELAAAIEALPPDSIYLQNQAGLVAFIKARREGALAAHNMKVAMGLEGGT